MTQFQFDPALVEVQTLEPSGRPLHVEVGFGKDVRILKEAERHPDEDYFGVEISRKKARKFCEKVARAGLRNVRAYHGDVRHVLQEMLPEASVQSFTILFPDPWPKRRHWKHRWIQPATAELLARTLRPGGRITAATDHAGYREQIRECLLGAGLELECESEEIPPDDRTLFAMRFERLGHSVRYLRWVKPDQRDRPPRP
jgi:tRNA (guanine-N(7)-)-methyltransferase